MAAIACICHKGELEIKTAFLIHSIRKYMSGDFTVYTGIPEENDFIKAPSSRFLDFCMSNNVTTFRFRNTYLDSVRSLKEGDLISNKIFVPGIDFREDYLVFMDSDTLLIRPFNIRQMIANTSNIRLKPANRSNIRNWEEIFAGAGLKFPGATLTTAVDHKKIPPYFNSGVMIFHRAVLKQLADTWIQYFKWLSAETESKFFAPLFHRDQIALALAITKLQMPFDILEENFNHPVRSKKINISHIPYIVHYHNPSTIYFNKILKYEFQEFHRLYPYFLDDRLNDWHKIFNGSPSDIILNFLREMKRKAKGYLTGW